MLIPLSIYVLWILIFDLGSTQTERVAIFKDYFPEFLNGRWNKTIISISFCIIAIILSSNNLNLTQKFWRLLNATILIISSLLLLLNFFSIM